MTERAIAVRRTPVRVFRVDLPCERCEVGNMQLDRQAPIKTSYPPLRQHACSNCGLKVWVTTTYPRYEYEEIVECL